MNRRLLQGPAILWVRAGNQAVGESNIVHVGTQRADMGQAPVEEHVAMGADPAPGGFQTDQPTQSRRNPYGAAPIHTQGDRAEPSRYSRCRTAGRAPGVVGGIVRVTAYPMVGIGARPPDADLLHVGVAHQQGAGCAHAGPPGRVMGCGMIMAKDAGSRGPADWQDQYAGDRLW